MNRAQKIMNRDLNVGQSYLLANNTKHLLQRDVYGDTIFLTFDDSSCLMFKDGECYEIDFCMIFNYEDRL